MVKINLFPEKWKVIPDYPDYAASNQGKIMRVTDSKMYRGGYRSYAGKILKPSFDKDGYCLICLSRNKKQKSYRLSRLVALCFFGVCPPNKEVNHKNGIKTDNKINNLEYVTTQENVKHAYEIGLRKPIGYPRKLKAKDIPEIFQLYALEVLQKEIAQSYNVSPMIISRILRGKIWRKR